MSYETLDPQIFGSIFPPAGELTLLATMDLNQNAYGTVVITNTSGSVVERARIAIQPLKDTDKPIEPHNYIAYDLRMPQHYTIQLPNIALSNGDKIWGYSLYGNLSFMMSGDQIINNY